MIKSFWVALSIAALPSPGAAQTPAVVETADARPAVQAVRVETAPVLDGEVLEDPAFATIEPASGFLQNTPADGEPISERTEVRVVYTRDTLYFGIVCFDREPADIIVTDSRRDSDLDDTDSVFILLDTYLDGQNGFIFGTNPSGLEYDGQVIKEGEGTGFIAGSRGAGGGSATGRQSNSTAGSFNLNWDGSWQVRTKTSPIGWSAEFAIPFRTLRYTSGTTWGVNFQRNIRRRKESAYWAPIPRGLSLYRVSLAGRLNGLQVPAQRNLKLMPYVLGETRHNARPRDTDLFGDAGIDLKYSLTPSLTLDLTYNTDFAQVEVDEEQVNLNRFRLFFPEKRPFFLENAGAFNIGNPGAIEVFFSRRIGISANGVEIPIVGGARLSGNIGRTSVGFINMQTDEVRGLAPANNYNVVRMNREFRNRSSLGALFTSRQATGSLARDHDYNLSYAVDGRLGTSQYGKLAGFAARTQSPDRHGQEHAYDFGWLYEAPKLLMNLQYTEVGNNFNPEVGFVNRVGYRQLNTLWFKFIRMGPSSPLHELRPHVRTYSYWNFNGFNETAYAHLDNHWEFKNSNQIDSGMNLSREGLVRPFEIYPGIFVPPGTYDNADVQLVGITNQSKPLNFRVSTVAGGFFDGKRLTVSPTLRFRMGETFSTELSLQRNDIDLPGGSFVTNLIRARIAYSFSPRVFVQSLVQYNDRADLWSMNFRFNWLQQANTGLFVVYNDTHGLGDVELAGLGRSLIVKISRLFDVLN